MIRHHQAQDSLSAEAAPMYFGAGMPMKTHQVLLPGVAAVPRDGGSPYVSPHHAFAADTALLSMPILLAASMTAVVTLWQPYRKTVQLLGIRDRYRAFLLGFDAPCPGPSSVKAHQPL
jgi:hypothetical protein